MPFHDATLRLMMTGVLVLLASIAAANLARGPVAELGRAGQAPAPAGLYEDTAPTVMWGFP